MRSPIAFVNEVSLPPKTNHFTEDQVLSLLSDFVDLLRSIAGVRPDMALAAAVPLSEIPLTADGRTFPNICQATGGVAVEWWRYVQRRRNVAPFIGSSELTVPDATEEYRTDSVQCAGVGAAVASGQLAVSFRSGPQWDTEWLLVEHSYLVEDDAGAVTTTSTSVSALHAATPAHVVLNRERIGNLALPEAFSGADVWADRSVRFPNLRFLPRVQAQLAALKHGSTSLTQIFDRLVELESAVSAWKPNESMFPEWKSLVTAEADQRKQLCNFTDRDGQVRCFDLHARFTPGAGRIHFRLLPTETALCIAHVGMKLG